MFTFIRPTQPRLAHLLTTAANSPLGYQATLNTTAGPAGSITPPGYIQDHTRTRIFPGPASHGRSAFERAKTALRQWQQFNLGWVAVANPGTPIAVNKLVAVLARTPNPPLPGLWTINISRILQVIDTEDSFGFLYGTTPHHTERGEERFLLTLDPATGQVHYDLLAISQPAHWLAKAARPITRHYQKKFARDSHQRMQQFTTTP